MATSHTPPNFNEKNATDVAIDLGISRIVDICEQFIYHKSGSLSENTTFNYLHNHLWSLAAAAPENDQNLKIAMQLFESYGVHVAVQHLICTSKGSDVLITDMLLANTDYGHPKYQLLMAYAIEYLEDCAHRSIIIQCANDRASSICLLPKEFFWKDMQRAHDEMPKT